MPSLLHTSSATNVGFRRDNAIVGPVNLILIGCGAVSRLFYQPAINELIGRNEVRLAAVVDPLESARLSLLEHLSSGQSVSDLRQVEAPAGSLAIIASPPRFHSAHCHAALERGWHVLCEKPMATTASDCATMTRAAEAADRVLAVGLYKRFFPSSEYLHELCHGGALGRLLSFDLQEGGPFNWPAASPSFFVKSETTGGVLLDIGVHVLDLLLWWLGDPASFDYADDAMGGLETNAVLKLSYPSGTKGKMHLSRDWTTRQRYSFEFEKGTVEWTVNQANAITVQLKGLSSLEGTLVDSRAVPALTNPQCFIAQLQNVLAAVRGHTLPRVNGRDGERVTQLIENCYAHRRLLAQPWLEPAEAARAGQLAQRA
jgi:predicted dehydrogenase